MDESQSISKISSGNSTYDLADVQSRASIVKLSKSIEDLTNTCNSLRDGITNAEQSSKKYTDDKLSRVSIPIKSIREVGNIWIE